MTSDELREYVRRRPFHPFRVRMHDGTNVEITRTQQMAVMDTKFVAEVKERMKFFPIDQVVGVEEMQPA